MILQNAENNIKKVTKKLIIMVINMFKVPILIFTILLLLICYITDIFYIGIKNEDKSNMKKEIKYYTSDEYTEEDSKSFFESVGDFISGLFVEISENSDWPVEGKSEKNISSYYGSRSSPTSGVASFHNRH